jgi:ElaB/YqjD/DUF883 family membrane-anchored ribosome-binding protein
MSIGDKGPREPTKKGEIPEELNDQIEVLRSELQNLTTTVTDVAGKQFGRAHESIEQRIRNNPIAAVGIAAAIGFLYAMIRR